MMGLEEVRFCLYDICNQITIYVVLLYRFRHVYYVLLKVL